MPSARASRRASTGAANSPLGAQHQGAQHHVPTAPGPASTQQPTEAPLQLALPGGKKKKKQNLPLLQLPLRERIPKDSPGHPAPRRANLSLPVGLGGMELPQTLPGTLGIPPPGSCSRGRRAGGTDARPCSAASRCRVCSCRCPAPAGSTSSVAAQFFQGICCRTCQPLPAASPQGEGRGWFITWIYCLAGFFL